MEGKERGVIDLETISKIDFNTLEIQKEFNKMEEENEEIIRSSKESKRLQEKN